MVVSTFCALLRCLVSAPSTLPAPRPPQVSTFNMRPVPEGVREGYISHIDAILAESDLATISVNNVRQKLQERVEDDITAQKVDTIMDIFACYKWC